MYLNPMTYSMPEMRHFKNASRLTAIQKVEDYL